MNTSYSDVLIVQDDGSATVKYSWSDNWPVNYIAWDVAQPNGAALQAGSGCTKMNRSAA